MMTWLALLSLTAQQKLRSLLPKYRKSKRIGLKDNV